MSKMPQAIYQLLGWRWYHLTHMQFYRLSNTGNTILTLITLITFSKAMRGLWNLSPPSSQTLCQWSNHKPMGMDDGGLHRLALGEKRASSLPLEQRATAPWKVLLSNVLSICEFDYILWESNWKKDYSKSQNLLKNEQFQKRWCYDLEKAFVNWHWHVCDGIALMKQGFWE